MKRRNGTLNRENELKEPCLIENLAPVLRKLKTVDLAPKKISELFFNSEKSKESFLSEGQKLQDFSVK